MASYFGFEPGTYQPWALNLMMDTLGQPGVARGMLVTASSPATMVINVGIDAVQLDGVCFLPNGAWCRIDASVPFTVPNNTSGSTRTDALVVQIDPTGVSTSQIAYVQSWTTQFNPQAYAGSVNNTLVLALITVPNNATSIAQGNISNTILQAQAGTAPQGYVDSVVTGERQDAPDGGQPGIFVLNELQITASATNGQTSFSPSLTVYQRLVPQGRIGGALETGYFSGPNGWYWPKVRGSVSGLIPVLNVDPVAGTITTAQGASSGEAVYLSYKYYDFSRDTKVRAGAMYVEKTSPYLVYQGEVVEDPYGKQNPLWDGSQGGYLLFNPGESVFYTDYTAVVQFPFLGGPGTSTNQVTLIQNGVAQYTRFTNATAAPPGVTYQVFWVDLFFPSNAVSVCQFKLVSGILGCCGARNFLNSGAGVTVSGGLVAVQGQPVLLQNTSFTLPLPTSGAHKSYTVYTDKYGNITASIAAPAGMERTLGRIPLSGAAQYGSPFQSSGTNTSSSYGYWPLPNSYLGWPTSVVYTTLTTASPNAGINNSWNFAQDQLSPFGGYATGGAGTDVFTATAVCTGMDLLVRTSGATSSFSVWVDQPPLAAPQTVRVVGTTQYNVRVTLFSNLPYGSHTVRVQNLTTSLPGLDALDIRVPASPASPSGTLPLAQVDVLGWSSHVTPSLPRGSQIGSNTSLSTSFVVDSWRSQAEPAVWFANTSTASIPLVLILHGTGSPTIHYQAGPDKGIVSVNNFSFDCYAVSPVMDTTVLYPGGGNVNSLSFSSTGQKNGSSSSVQAVINAVDFVPFQTVVTDLRHFNLARGIPSELRGSALADFQGGRFDDGGYGLRTAQYRDRSVTSRKVAPTWKRSLATASYSGFPGIYPSLSAVISVEMPSVLLVQAQLNLVLGASAAASAQLYVDGGPISDGSVFGNSSVALWGALSVSDMVVVPAGTHTLQISVSNGGSGGGQPYINTSGQPQTLSVIAFAL